MPEDVAGLLVDPAGGARAPEPGGGELPAVAALAVDLPVVAGADGVEGDLLLAGEARRALVVVAAAAGRYLLRLEDLRGKGEKTGWWKYVNGDYYLSI